jgi:hypothetical protein
MKKIYLISFFLYSGISLRAQQTTFEWAKSIGGYYGLATGVDVAVDNSNNVYTTGTFEGKVNFDPGSGVFNLTTSGYGVQDIFICKYNNTGNLIWAGQIAGTGTQYVTALAVDGSGNIYVTGFFYSADFDPGPSVFTLTSVGGFDTFILKLDNSGNFTWARQIGNNFSGNEYAYSIAVDGTGNVYTTGQFQGTSDFDPGTGIFTLATGGSRDIFVSKLDSSGNFVWAKQFAGNNINVGNSIVVDASGNVYTAGYFKDSVDFDPGSAALIFVSHGQEDIFVSKLDASGNLVWARQMGGGVQDIATSIALDASGNVYTTGYYWTTADFDPGPGIYNLTSSANSDIFISKLDASGNFAWAKSQGGTGYDRAYSIAVDSFGTVYTTGYFFGTGDFDPGGGTVNLTSFNYSYDIFVSKLFSNGSLAWVKQLGGAKQEEGNSIAVDGSGNVFGTLPALLILILAQERITCCFRKFSLGKTNGGRR